MRCDCDSCNRWVFWFDEQDIQMALLPESLGVLLAQHANVIPPEPVLKRVSQLLAEVPRKCIQSLIDHYVDTDSLMSQSPEELEDLGLAHDQLQGWSAAQWAELQSRVIFKGVEICLLLSDTASDVIESEFYNAFVIDPWKRCWDVGDGYIDGYHQYE
jgi:hypothetical protein